MSATIFLDTETTGLSDADEIWEFAAIRREDDGSEREVHAFVEHNPMLCAALPPPFCDDHLARFPGVGEAGYPTACQGYGEGVLTGDRATALLADLFAGRPTLVAAAPHFDAGMVTRLMRWYGRRPGWSHRYRCAETLAAGYLGYDPGGLSDCAEALGIEVDYTTRHTARGDMLLCRAIWDRVMTGKGFGDG